MKGVVLLEMDKQKAKEAWKEYCAGIKGKKGGFLKEYYAMKYAYFALKEGRKIIDVYQAFEKAGLNEYGQPRLAIAPASFKSVHFAGHEDGHGSFSKGGWNYPTNSNSYVYLPEHTFRFPKDQNKRFETIQLTAKVPIVPIKFLPAKLDGYFILWEVGKYDKWNVVPKDPFLLKRISPNLFVVVAYWDLSPLERALVAGR
jgi:hypothetical protein